MEMTQLVETDQIRTFVTAGNAVFTLKSLKTGEHLTYKVRESDRDGLSFVYARRGSRMDYLGCLWSGEKYVQSRGSKFDRGEAQAKGFSWFWTRLSSGDLPETVEVWHEGKCGRCNRELTDPESISWGLGPVCREKLGLA